MPRAMTTALVRTAGLGAALLGATLLGAVLAGCGGSNASNPFDIPLLVGNPAGTSGQKLSFAYFQRCINPIFLTSLQISQNGVVSTNTCAASGCHDNNSGTGGAFRVIGAAATLDVSDPANSPAVIRASDMYKNYYSSQGAVVVNSPTESRLLNKPLLRGALHGGGLIFANDQDPNVKLIQYWISHPAPAGQDEFSVASNTMFTPADPKTGTCNTP
jgi:hypothetical protein